MTNPAEQTELQDAKSAIGRMKQHLPPELHAIADNVGEGIDILILYTRTGTLNIKTGPPRTEPYDGS